MQGELFPKDVVSNVPRITLIGHERLTVEQHRGLMDYNPEYIAFRSAVGLIRIAGAGMRFKEYTSAEAIVIGRIDSVSLAGKETIP